jgi:fructose-specific phosphotransferase system IIA component
VILARSMNVPTLVRVSKAMAALRPGQEAIVDGELGLLVTEISEPVRRYYRMERDTLTQRRRQLDAFRTQPGKTTDGHAIEVAANVARTAEVAIALRGGAQGIGLFRTEMLFMDRAAPPGEAEQAEIYRAAVTAAGDQPVIIRLIDIGGDKPAPYLNLPAEANPFLGYRGARLYREFAELVKTQLRAILRASVAGNVKILVPMVCCLEEVRDVRQLLTEAAEELAKNGVKIDRLPSLGVMIEVPSVAFLMPELCREVDFFSIGSNDLIQYFLAADRANQKVSSLYTWSHPAFLRLLKSVVDQAKARGKWIGLCGEMGDAAAALPLLTGLGLDEISVSAPRLGDAKAAINASSFIQCRQLVDAAVNCATRAEVEALLPEASATSDANAPVFSADLIVKSDAVTKEEVIRQLTNTLHLAGRVPRRQALEEAIWRREDTYSTGFGHGFAVPHCKCDWLTANSMAIAKLATPVEWGSMDGKPVDVVILLAIRPQDHAQQHMRIFARLSRLVMREEFRDHVRQTQDPVELAAYIERELDQRPQPATA